MFAYLFAKATPIRLPYWAMHEVVLIAVKAAVSIEMAN